MLLDLRSLLEDLPPGVVVVLSLTRAHVIDLTPDRTAQLVTGTRSVRALLPVREILKPVHVTRLLTPIRETTPL